jgi:hypothetical protein
LVDLTVLPLAADLAAFVEHQMTQTVYLVSWLTVALVVALAVVLFAVAVGGALGVYRTLPLMTPL